MVLKRLAIIGFGFVGTLASGCVSHETHVIRPVPGLYSVASPQLEGPAQVQGAEADVAGQGDSSPGAPAARAMRGVWLYRLVEMPVPGEGKEVTSLELIFCPPVKDDSSKCRISRVWSLDIHPLGTTVQ